MSATLRLMALAVLSMSAHAANPTVTAAEQSYADFLDAHGALETIDSGLLRAVEGRDRPAWQQARERAVADFRDRTAELRAATLDAEDARALRLMRLTFDELAGNGAGSMTPKRKCSEAHQPDVDLATLQASLYACFDEIGNRLSFEGETLTRGAALQRLQELPEPARRKALFLAMAPLWEAVNDDGKGGSAYRRMIAAASASFRAGAESPVGAAVQALGIDTPTLERWLVAALDSWREATVDPSHLIEPWDYRHRYAEASRALNGAVTLASLTTLNQRYFADLGADPRELGVLFDLEPRPGKAPIAYADTVRIGRVVQGKWRPAIPRISANYERGGLYTLNELLHETGHAAHYVAIRTRPAFFWPDTLFIEAFADVPSWSVFEPQWQQRYLGRSVTREAGLRELHSLVMLDVAWGLYELRILRSPQLDPNVLWSDITQRYLGVARHPEWSWWAVRAQLVSNPGYMINYAAGAIITADLRKRTSSRIGTFDAGSPRWYAWLSEELLEDGAELETSRLLEQFLGRPVSPEALIEEIRSIAPTQSRASVSRPSM
jgi:hypothetical protein